MNESFSTSELVYLNVAGKHGKTLGYILMGGSMFTFSNVLIEVILWKYFVQKIHS